MSTEEWNAIFNILERYSAKLTVAVTASWVEKDGSLTSFPVKFPEELKILQKGIQKELVEIACHGLTHCVLNENAFLPKMTRGNRMYHREFWDWLPAETHYNNLERALDILKRCFHKPIEVLVPPGNVYSADTIAAAKKLGIKVINCHNPSITDEAGTIKTIGNEQVIDFHDREVVLNGPGWLENKLKSQPKNIEYRFISEL